MTEETKAPAPAAEGSAPSERPRSAGRRHGAPRHDGPRSGPRFGGRSGPGGPPREGGRKFFRRKKVCKFCVEKIENINYKDYRMLGQFVQRRERLSAMISAQKTEQLSSQLLAPL